MKRSTPSASSPGGIKLIARNKRARYNYELLDHYEAGLVLIGSEARSLRMKGADLSDAWVDLDARGEAWLKGLRVPVLEHAAFGHGEQRVRKLLLHAEEIQKLRVGVERGGLTVVATRLYFKNNRAKVEVALARGKRQHDKRQALRERDATREAEQAMRRVRTG